MAAQVAGSFVKIVAPAAVGGVALNTRFLQRAGVRPGLAVASVGASQLFGLGCHILMLLSFGYLTGTEKTPSLSPSRTVIAGLLTVAVLVLVVTSVPFLRKFVVTRVRSLFAGVVPRMLDVLQRPQKLITGIGGMLLLTACFVMCLDASIRAFGDGTVSLSIASVAVVFLAGNALGSAAPTPGGVGAVEATPHRRSDRGGPAQGGRRPGRPAVPAADPVAAGPAGLAGLQPPHPQREPCDSAAASAPRGRTSYGPRPARPGAHARTMGVWRTPPGCAPSR